MEKSAFSAGPPRPSSQTGLEGVINKSSPEESPDCSGVSSLVDCFMSRGGTGDAGADAPRSVGDGSGDMAGDEIPDAGSWVSTSSGAERAAAYEPLGHSSTL